MSDTLGISRSGCLMLRSLLHDLFTMDLTQGNKFSTTDLSTLSDLVFAFLNKWTME